MGFCGVFKGGRKSTNCGEKSCAETRGEGNSFTLSETGCRPNLNLYGNCWKPMESYSQVRRCERTDGVIYL